MELEEIYVHSKGRTFRLVVETLMNRGIKCYDRTDSELQHAMSNACLADYRKICFFSSGGKVMWRLAGYYYSVDKLKKVSGTKFLREFNKTSVFKGYRKQ